MKNVIKKCRLLSMFSLMIAVFFLVQGCGTNLFEGLDNSSDDRPIESVQNDLDDANSPEEFEKVRLRTDALLENDDLSVSDRKDLLEIKSQAIFGAGSVDSFALVGELYAFNDSQSGNNSIASTGNDEDNLIDFLEVLLESITTADLREAADAINEAARLSSENTGLSMSESLQLYRGIADSLAIVGMINTYLDIDLAQEAIEYIDDFSQSDIAEIIESLMDINGDGYDFDNPSAIQNTDSISQYAREALQAFSVAGLPDDLQEEVDKVLDIPAEFEKLYAAMNNEGNGSDPGIFNGQYSVREGAENREQNIEDALSKIFVTSLEGDN